MAATVTLDAMIKREDFAVSGDQAGDPDAVKTLSVENLSSSGLISALLRKPDFQRETNHWTPEQLVSFLESFLDSELIPSIILWRSESYVFAIDGGHRLSALRAWIEDDYGDGYVSRNFYSGEISDEQLRIARRTRTLDLWGPMVILPLFGLGGVLGSLELEGWRRAALMVFGFGFIALTFSFIYQVRKEQRFFRSAQLDYPCHVLIRIR